MNEGYGQSDLDGWDPATWERMREGAHSEVARIAVAPKIGLPIERVEGNDTVVNVDFYDSEAGRVSQDYTIPFVELVGFFGLTDEQVEGHKFRAIREIGGSTNRTGSRAC